MLRTSLGKHRVTAQRAPIAKTWRSARAGHVDQSPLHAAVDGNRLCVTHFGGTMSVIDTTTNCVVGSIPAGVQPGYVAVDGGLAYVSNWVGNGTVSVIDIAAEVVTATIPVGSSPLGIAVSPDGTHVYVANHGPDTVSVIDTATNTVTETIAVGIGAFDVAANSSGGRIYVPNSGDDTVTVIKYEGPKKFHPTSPTCRNSSARSSAAPPAAGRLAGHRQSRLSDPAASTGIVGHCAGSRALPR